MKKRLLMVEHHPELVQELHPTLNLDISIKDLTVGSHKKIFWLCPQKHTYSASVKNRTNGSSCPYCSGRLITSTRTLLHTHPKLAAQFHQTKNHPLKTTTITQHYRQEVWWYCEHGHEWQEKVTNRARREQATCKICNSFGYRKPDLLREWHPNNPSPYDFSANSNKKVNWVCKNCGFIWLASIANRFRGSGCPGCSGASVTTRTSVASCYPDIAKEWDYELNDTTPDKVSAGGDYIAHLICKNGHRYTMPIYDRTKRSRGCQHCKTVVFLQPHLIDEWHPSNPTSPYEEKAGSGKRVLWICKECQNIWSSKIVDRTHGAGCPQCADQNNSKGIKRIEIWLRNNGYSFEREKSFSTLRSNRHGNNFLRFDFFLSNQNLFIEFDGVQHYKPQKSWGGEEAFKELRLNDEQKNTWSKENGYKLLRISFRDEQKIESILSHQMAQLNKPQGTSPHPSKNTNING